MKPVRRRWTMRRTFKSHLPAQMFPKPITQPVVCPASQYLSRSFCDPKSLVPSEKKQGRSQFSLYLFRSVNPCVIFTQKKLRVNSFEMSQIQDHSRSCYIKGTNEFTLEKNSSVDEFTLDRENSPFDESTLDKNSSVDEFTLDKNSSVDEFTQSRIHRLMNSLSRGVIGWWIHSGQEFIGWWIHSVEDSSVDESTLDENSSVDESTMDNYLSVLSMHHDLSDLGSLVLIQSIPNKHNRFEIYNQKLYKACRCHK